MLKGLASHESVTALDAEINQAVNLDPEQERRQQEMFRCREETPEWDLDAEVSVYQSRSTDELWDCLGIVNTDRVIPGMASSHDPDKRITTWDVHTTPGLSKHLSVNKRLHWHQLVAVLKNTEFVTKHACGLCLDDVGLGKTVQALATAAYRAVLVKSIKAGKKQVGVFGE